MPSLRYQAQHGVAVPGGGFGGQTHQKRHRYYSFNTNWAPGEQMASMRNGSGDAYSIVFSPAGAFIRGLDHESPMNPARTGNLWPGLVDATPDVFHNQVHEPAFSFNGHLDATFALWRQHHDDHWQTGTIDFPANDSPRPSPDGAEILTPLCQPDPDSYRAFASDYYGIALDIVAVSHIWVFRPLDDAIVTALNPKLSLADIQQDADEIGLTRW